MQMVHGAKLSRLQGLAEIRGKAFAVVLFSQYLIKNSLKNLVAS